MCGAYATCSLFLCAFLDLQRPHSVGPHFVRVKFVNINLTHTKCAQATFCASKSSSTLCPVTCAVCIPTGASSGNCTDLDDALYMLDNYGVSCAGIAAAGVCYSFVNMTRDVLLRCPIACQYCGAPLTIPCTSDNDTAMEQEYGSGCKHMANIGLCAKASNNTASERVAEMMRINCGESCQSCNTYWSNYSCAGLHDNDTYIYSIFKLNCSQMAAVSPCLLLI